MATQRQAAQLQVNANSADYISMLLSALLSIYTYIHTYILTSVHGTGREAGAASSIILLRGGRLVAYLCNRHYSRLPAIALPAVALQLVPLRCLLLRCLLLRCNWSPCVACYCVACYCVACYCVACYCVACHCAPYRKLRTPLCDTAPLG